MNSKFKGFFKKSEAKTKSKDFTKMDFFTENNVNGYFSKPSFREYLTQFNEQEARHFDMGLTNSKIGCKLNNNIVPKFETNDGHEVLWLRFAQARRDMAPIFVIAHENIQRFFIDYQRGLINPNFNLDDLMDEAGITVPEQEEIS